MYTIYDVYNQIWTQIELDNFVFICFNLENIFREYVNTLYTIWKDVGIKIILNNEITRYTYYFNYLLLKFENPVENNFCPNYLIVTIF